MIVTMREGRLPSAPLPIDRGYKMNYIQLLENLRDKSVIVDMTHPLETGIPNWPTQPPFSTTVFECQEWGCESFHRAVTMSEHSGTHIDAPCHFIPGAPSIDEIPVNLIMGRGVNIDATDTLPCGLVMPDKVKNFEKVNGKIKKGDIVFFRFGWDKKWALRPDCSEFLRDWPGISPEVGQYLLEREVNAVGCDTLALDAYNSSSPNHFLLLSHGICILENVNMLGKLPCFFGLLGLPCRFRGGSASTIRLLAFVDKVSSSIN